MMEHEIFNVINLDFAKSWQLLFQDPATPIMEGIIDLHHNIMFFLLLILFLVLLYFSKILLLVSTLFLITFVDKYYSSFAVFFSNNIVLCQDSAGVVEVVTDVNVNPENNVFDFNKYFVIFVFVTLIILLKIIKDKYISNATNLKIIKLYLYFIGFIEVSFFCYRLYLYQFTNKVILLFYFSYFLFIYLSEKYNFFEKLKDVINKAYNNLGSGENIIISVFLWILICFVTLHYYVLQRKKGEKLISYLLKGTLIYFTVIYLNLVEYWFLFMFFDGLVVYIFRFTYDKNNSFRATIDSQIINLSKTKIVGNKGTLLVLKRSMFSELFTNGVTYTTVKGMAALIFLGGAGMYVQGKGEAAVRADYNNSDQNKVFNVGYKTAIENGSTPPNPPPSFHPATPAEGFYRGVDETVKEVKKFSDDTVDYIKSIYPWRNNP